MTLYENYYSNRIMNSLILTNASVIPLYYKKVLRFMLSGIQGFE